MKAIRIKKPSDTMLDGIKVGVGATYRVGSDCYPYYVSSINGTIVGICRAKTSGYSNGQAIVAPFDPNSKTESYRKIYRNAWYECDKDGNLVVPHRKAFPLCYGHACSYLDPSF